MIKGVNLSYFTKYLNIYKGLVYLFTFNLYSFMMQNLAKLITSERFCFC